MKSETPQPAAAQPLKEASAVKQIAERIARSAHEGQMEELTGDDYIRHIERVVSLVSGDDAKAVAWLHDVLEDTDVTSAYLIAAGIPDEVRLAVERLTRGDEPYAAYIETIRSSGPMLARVVKVADLRDHLRPNCPERLRQRYEKALAALESEVQPPAAAPVQDLAYDVRMMTDKQLADVLSSRAALDANQEFGRWLGRLLTAWVTDSPLADIDAIIAERAGLIQRYCPEHLRLTADELYRVMQAWEGQPASEEQTRIVIKLGALREGAVRAGDSPFVTPLDQPIPQPLQPPAAATQARPWCAARSGHGYECTLRQGHEGNHQAYGWPTEKVIEEWAAEPLQPAAAAPQDETLALVNQALTKAGSRHIVGTKDGVIVACTIEEALQPAAAAPPIDLLELEQLIEEKRGRCRYWNVSVQGYSELQNLIREGEFQERLLARLRALQGTRSEDLDTRGDGFPESPHGDLPRRKDGDK